MEETLTRAEAVTPVIPTNNSLDSLSNEQLVSEINKLQGNTETVNSQPITIVPPATQGQEQVVTTPVSKPAEPGQVDTQQKVPTPEVTEPGKDKATFEQLASKKGMKSPDDLANSYVNLERQYSKTAQELAKMKQTGVVQQPVTNAEPVAPVQPQPVQYDNQQVIEALNSDAVGVIAQIVKEVIKPFEQERYQNKLKSKIVNLCSNPETADFGTEEIHNQIVDIIKTRPQYGENLADNIEDLYYMAKGRIGKNQITSAVELGKELANQQIQGKHQAIVEGASKPTGSEPFNIETADLESLRKLVESQLAKGSW